MDRRGVAKRIAIPIASSILILLLFVFISIVSANIHYKTTAYAYQVPSPSAQGTPTVDPTVTALQKEQVTQQINQQQHNFQNFLWNLITASLSTLALVIGGLIAFFRWLGDRRDARKKQAEERFKSVVDGLGGEDAEKKIASAVLLRTFLSRDYKEYYTQVFELAVASLRSREHTDSSITTKFSGTISQGLTTVLNVLNRELQKSIQKPNPNEVSTSKSLINIPQTLDSLSQALVTVFKESFPRARKRLKRRNALRRILIRVLEKLIHGITPIRKGLMEVEGTLVFDPQLLDASGVKLDKAFLYGVDLREAWMPDASLKE